MFRNINGVMTFHIFESSEKKLTIWIYRFTPDISLFFILDNMSQTFHPLINPGTPGVQEYIYEKKQGVTLNMLYIYIGYADVSSITHNKMVYI